MRRRRHYQSATEILVSRAIAVLVITLMAITVAIYSL